MDLKAARAALRGAASAIGRGAPGDALEPARRAWEHARTSACAALVHRLSGLVERPGLPVDKREAMQQQWLAIDAARDPADVPRLVRALQQTHFRSTDALVRAKRLAARPPDPRIPALLVEELVCPRFRATSARPFWRQVFDLFARHADARTSALLAAYARDTRKVFSGKQEAATRSWFARTASEVAASLAMEEPPELREAAALLAELEAITRAADKLVADVLADPEDDGPREVLADALQDRGDPRGELVALQLAEARGRATGAMQARCVELVREYREAWVGALRDVVQPEACTFDRGFLDHARLDSPEELLAARIDDPTWSTVTSLHAAWSPALAALLRKYRVPELTLDPSDDDRSPVFDERDLPLRSLTFYGPAYRRRGAADVFEPAEVARLAKTRALPKLEHLGLDLVGGSLAWLREVPWIRKLKALSLSADHWPEPPLDAWLAALEPFPNLATLRVVRDELTISITRSKRTVSKIEVACEPSWCANVAAAVGAIAKRGTRVEVEAKKLPAAFAKLDATVVLCEPRPILTRWWAWARRGRRL